MAVLRMTEPDDAQAMHNTDAQHDAETAVTPATATTAGETPSASTECAPPQPIEIGGRYRHFKGNEYRVLALATDSETGESVVVYRALYGDGGIWTRPAAMFAESVFRDGRWQPRFAPIAEPEA